jgi:alanine dehydrogenase
MIPGQDILWLSEADVRALLTVGEALKVVENAFKMHGEGQVDLPPKVYLDFQPFGGDLRAMPVYVKGGEPAAGVKIVNSNPGNPEKGLPAVSGIVVYNDPKTGLPLGVFAAGTLTSLRTGAGGGVAAKYMARKNSSAVGLVGCGRQAETQLAALVELFPVKTVHVWGKTMQEAETFCAAQKAHVKAAFTPCANVEEVCAAADILVTTTPVRTPAVKAAWVKPGTHINAIGADAPGKQELETALLKKSRVVVDDWTQASHAGEINNAVTAGDLSEKDLVGQLGEVVIGKKKARQNDADITVFDSTGLALQDITVAQFLYKKAVQLHKGQVLKLNG